MTQTLLKPALSFARNSPLCQPGVPWVSATEVLEPGLCLETWTQRAPPASEESESARQATVLSDRQLRLFRLSLNKDGRASSESAQRSFLHESSTMMLPTA